jgi:hypothetical protein
VANDARREFVDLDVEEVSIVDKAANEEEFVVIKSLNQEESDMAEEKEKVIKTEDANAESSADGQTQVDDKAESVPVEVAKSNDEAIAQAAQKVVDLVSSIVTKNDDAGSEAGEPEAEETTTEKSEDEPAAEETPAPEGDTTTEETTKQFGADEVLDTIQEAIAKAKGLTPENTGALATIAKDLQGIVDKLTASTPVKTEKAAEDAPPATDFAPILKGITELADLVKDSVKVTKGLADRVDAIENTRAAPTSEGAEATDTEEKTEKSFWGSIL